MASANSGAVIGGFLQGFSDTFFRAREKKKDKEEEAHQHRLDALKMILANPDLTKEAKTQLMSDFVAMQKGKKEEHQAWGKIQQMLLPVEQGGGMAPTGKPLEQTSGAGQKAAPTTEGAATRPRQVGGGIPTQEIGPAPKPALTAGAPDEAFQRQSVFMDPMKAAAQRGQEALAEQGPLIKAREEAAVNLLNRKAEIAASDLFTKHGYKMEEVDEVGKIRATMKLREKMSRGLTEEQAEQEMQVEEADKLQQFTDKHQQTMTGLTRTIASTAKLEADTRAVAVRLTNEATKLELEAVKVSQSGQRVRQGQARTDAYIASLHDRSRQAGALADKIKQDQKEIEKLRESMVAVGSAYANKGWLARATSRAPNLDAQNAEIDRLTSEISGYQQQLVELDKPVTTSAASDATPDLTPKSPKAKGAGASASGGSITIGGQQHKVGDVLTLKDGSKKRITAIRGKQVDLEDVQ